VTQQHFEIGELAYHIRWRCSVIITGPIMMTTGVRVDTGEVRIGPAYPVVRHDDASGGWSAPAYELRKIPPPREDLQVVRWIDMPWQPNRVPQ
jgi:hypothetical protein